MHGRAFLNENEGAPKVERLTPQKSTSIIPWQQKMTGILIYLEFLNGDACHVGWFYIIV
jgi:hypothetical protein